MSGLTVADILDRAAAVIRRNGWNTIGYWRREGDLEAIDCPVCLLGAIGVVGIKSPSLWDVAPGCFEASVAVAKFIGIDTEPNGCPLDAEDMTYAIGDWNDANGRTVEEVLAALEGAARAERDRLAPPA